MNRTKSIAAYNEALQYIPGGVNSPVRALKSVGATPLFVQQAKGTTLTDVDGNRFTDFCLSWGVFILGHNHATINKAVRKAVANGTSFGIPTAQETDLAKLVNRHIPSMERVRFVSSGTEAVMSAIRLARGYTKRSLIVKFDGCYHGHADHLLVSAGSGVAGLQDASSSGVPTDFVKHTVSLPFNDIEVVENLFKEKGKEIAAIIVEPVPANMGVVLPAGGFLAQLKNIAERYGSLLIFDEVITGFRLSLGGAQQMFDVKPHLTTVGKIVGGGFPAAAFGGRADIMSFLSPEGSVYQAGTLSGNPVAMSAGIATLQALSEEGLYLRLDAKSEHFIRQLKDAVSGKNITINHIGSMFTLFFTTRKIQSFDDVLQADQQRFAKFFNYMLDHHFYISPSQFEANFISIQHNERELNRFIKTVSLFND
jgi:glutamate-1-semialdehyde 2,1-aminomutase